MYATTLRYHCLSQSYTLFLYISVFFMNDYRSTSRIRSPDSIADKTRDAMNSECTVIPYEMDFYCS